MTLICSSPFREFAIFHMISPFHHRFITAYPSFFVKSAMASDILICCGQTASQLRHPMHALGRLSSGMAANAIGSNESSIGKRVLIIQRKQRRNIQPHGTVADTVVTGRTGQDDLFHHGVCDAKQCLLFLLIQRRIRLKGPDILCIICSSLDMPDKMTVTLGMD